ncbi:MAG: hypothetical protein JWR40_108 [Massilia sp.]|nr:hypothetical protein [Massilia sp.]
MLAVQDTLRYLLDQNTRFALDARGTTNHCPMALVALARMGAGPDRLEAFFARWSEQYAIVETQPGMALSGDEWFAHVGNHAAFSSLRGHFLDAIRRDGATAVVAEVLSRTPQAPATGAFHAFIRVGYGIEAGHAGEIASGLAAYVATNLPVGIDCTGRRAAVSVEEGFASLADQLAGRDWPVGSITARLKAIAADPTFRRVLQSPPVGSSLLDDLARASIALYWQTADFTVLHMVTGVYAARLVLAQLPASLVHHMPASIWAALCAAYVSAGAQPLVSIDAPKVDAAWPDILRRAIASDDDHVIKMAYTCSEESKRYPDSSWYLAAAARIAG